MGGLNACFSYKSGVPQTRMLPLLLLHVHHVLTFPHVPLHHIHTPEAYALVEPGFKVLETSRPRKVGEYNLLEFRHTQGQGTLYSSQPDTSHLLLFGPKPYLFATLQVLKGRQIMVTAIRSNPRDCEAVSKQAAQDAMYFIPKAHDPNFLEYWRRVTANRFKIYSHNGDVSPRRRGPAVCDVDRAVSEDPPLREQAL